MRTQTNQMALKDLSVIGIGALDNWTLPTVYAHAATQGEANEGGYAPDGLDEGRICRGTGGPWHAFLHRMISSNFRDMGTAYRNFCPQTEWGNSSKKRMLQGLQLGMGFLQLAQLAGNFAQLRYQ